jgi:hypothetical protein
MNIWAEFCVWMTALYRNFEGFWESYDGLRNNMSTEPPCFLTMSLF